MRLPAGLIVRDLVVLGLTLLAWLLSRHLDSTASAWAIPVAVLAGLLTPLAGFLAHEWGHLFGAWLGRSVVHYPTGAWSIFLFSFDAEHNNRRQFLSMSYGGFLASALIVALLLMTLTPTRLADAIALGLTGVGVLATAILEIPPAWQVYRGQAYSRAMVEVPLK